MSHSLRPHGLQHGRPPCPSPTLRICSNSCPLSWWRHRTISSSVVPFSSCLQSCPGSFHMSQLFTSGGQSIGASASVLPMNIQDWFPLVLTGVISSQSKLWRVFSSTTIWKHQCVSKKYLNNLTKCFFEYKIINWIIKKAREFQENIYFSFIDYAKAFDCVDHNKLWKILKNTRPPDLPLEKSVCRSGSKS